MHRLHGADRRHAGGRAPHQKFIGGAGIGPARVRVADVGREKFEEAHACALAGGGDEGRECGRRGDRYELNSCVTSCLSDPQHPLLKAPRIEGRVPVVGVLDDRLLSCRLHEVEINETYTRLGIRQRPA